MTQATIDSTKTTASQPLRARLLFFPGFYESQLSHGLESAYEAEINDCSEHNEPPPPEFCGKAWQKACQQAAAGYLHSVNAELRRILHIKDDPLGFLLIESPREYNFETDALYVTVDAKTALGMLRFLGRKKDNFASFQEVLRRRFESHDGFFSFYSPDFGFWLQKPVSTWDSVQIGALIEATLGVDEYEDFFDSDILYNEIVYKALYF